MSNEQKQPMSPSDAKRIQAHADKSGRNQDFKARAQRAAAKSPGTRTDKHRRKGKK